MGKCPCHQKSDFLSVVCAIPYEDLAPEVACLQEPLGVAIDLVRLAEIRPTSNVLVMGPGPIGLMALRLAQHMGAGRGGLRAIPAT